MIRKELLGSQYDVITFWTGPADHETKHLLQSGSKDLEGLPELNVGRKKASLFC